MGPRDRPLLLPDGAACTACGAAVPTGRIRVLARRDDRAFSGSDGDLVGWLDALEDDRRPGSVVDR